MRSCGPDANNSVAVLSSSPQSISYFEDSKERLTLKDFKKELSATFECITESHELLEPQGSQADLIADVFRYVVDATLISCCMFSAQSCVKDSNHPPSRLHLNPEELSRYTHFDDSKHYTRNLVATDNTHYTLLLLCWNPGKSSPIHDHPCDGCWMQVLEGQVRECRYERTTDGVLSCFSDETFYGTSFTCWGTLVLMSMRTFRSHTHCHGFHLFFFAEGQQLYINDTLGYHKVENPSLSQPAITLHLYCPPFDKCRIWMDPSRKSSNSKMTYHSQYGCLTSHTHPVPRS
jgi:cysteine dioxygenase